MAYVITVLLFLLAFLLGFVALRSLRRLIVSSSSRFSASLERVSDQVQALKKAQEANKRLLELLLFINNSSPAEPQITTHIDVNSSQPVLINLGCGSTFDRRWINLDLCPFSPDIHQLDLNRRLPFDDQSIDVAYSSHVLEHLSPHQVPCFMREVRRVLKQGGIFRIVVPDLEQITNQYLHSLRQARSGGKTDRLRHEWMVIELVDQVARQTNDGGEMIRFLLRHGETGLDIATQRLGAEIVSTPLPWDASKTKAEWIREIAADKFFSDDAIFERRRAMTELDTGLFRRSGEPHLWMYDEVSLTALFTASGFISVKRMTATSSRIADFASYQLDSTETSLDRKPDSLYMEAIKSSSPDC